MKYRAEIDGLRAVAVLPVMGFHAGWRWLPGGYVGVDVFFVISGYLITSLIVSEQRAGNFSFRTFYERRIRRILPALFLVMAACLPFAWLWMLPGDAKDFSKSLMAVAAFASNIFFWREGGYFETPGEFKPLLHTWSLAVEEQFYLLYPLLLLVVWRIGRRWRAATLAVAALASLGLAQWSSRYHPQGAFYLLPTRGWELLLGALVSLYLLGEVPRRDALPARASAWQQTLAALGLLLIGYAVLAFDRNIPYPSVYALVPTLGTALVILYAREGTLAGRLLNLPVLVGLGLISYSAYLWHQPLFAFARIRGGGDASAPLLCGLLLAALGLAYLSWRYVERPFRERGRVARSTVFSLAALLTLCLGLAGFAGYRTDGFASRYGEADRALAALDVYEAGVYVEQRFLALERRPFDDSGRLKVLLVGDSFAQDVLNAAYEGGITGGAQFSTHWIPTRCGNLYLKEPVVARVESSRQAICRNSNWYDDAAVRALMSQADVIWVASNWTAWEAQLLPLSVRNLRADFRARVLVFGPKNFGKFTIGQLLRVPAMQRPHYLNPVPASQIQLDAALGSALPAAAFLDVFRLLCGPANRCPLFTENGQLISFDGSHLTRQGAIYLGGRLAASDAAGTLAVPR